MSQITPVRYAVKKKERSQRAVCAMLEYVSPVEQKKMEFVSIAVRQDVRYVGSSWHLVPVTPAGNWSVKITESRSMSPRYVTTVGRVTNE